MLRGGPVRSVFRVAGRFIRLCQGDIIRRYPKEADANSAKAIE
jgi:hypothetical protein